MIKNNYRIYHKNTVKHNESYLLNRNITNITVRIYSGIVFPRIDYSTCLLNSTWQGSKGSKWRRKGNETEPFNQ